MQIAAATASVISFASLLFCSCTFVDIFGDLLLIHSVLHQLEDAGVSRILVITPNQYFVWFRSLS